MKKIKLKRNDDNVYVFTDGSHSPKTGNGGWGYVVVRHGREIATHSGAVAGPTTNNRMELMAILQAVTYIKDPVDLTKNLCIYSDSMSSVVPINQMLEKRREGTQLSKSRFSNYDLINQIVLTCLRRRVTFTWLKGHDKHRWNDIADELATSARLVMDLKTP